jgi:hypothetical protein
MDATSQRFGTIMGIIALLIVIGVMIFDIYTKSNEQKPNLECCKPMGCCDATESRKPISNHP